jgi:putative flavoprotein involved in K+ transport
MDQLDTIVIGAGQAGLAAGYHLQRTGQRFAILEASETLGGSWPRYYASLRLFSPARFSSLPGLPFPGDPERYPARDEVVAYLRQYAAHFRLPVITSAQVVAVARNASLFTVTAADGRQFQARSLIAATGSFHTPYLPELPGQEQFRGTILHSSAYQEPAPFAGKRVVVVGAGNSAVQIAVELARTARVTLATRAPVRYVPQRPLGRDIHFWWWLFGLDTSPLESLRGGLLNRLAGSSGPAVLDSGVYQAAIAAGMPEQRPMFERFTANGVEWPGGGSEAIDSVIFATGYRSSLSYLAPLGAFDDEGQLLQHHGTSTTVAGLGFVGLSNQRTLASATLRGVGDDAAVVVRALRSAGHVPAPRSRRLFGLIPCCTARPSGA